MTEGEKMCAQTKRAAELESSVWWLAGECIQSIRDYGDVHDEPDIIERVANAMLAVTKRSKLPSQGLPITTGITIRGTEPILR